MSVIALDQDGWPVMLADVSSTPTRVSGEGSTGPKQGAMSAYRRGDVVRDLAREFEDLSIQDLRERLPAMTTQTFTNGELSVLLAEVREQVLSDLVDLLDQRHQGRLRARRTVRVVAPRGYVVRTTARLSTQERGWVGGRLRQRGWSSDDVSRVLPTKA